jgi:hypothetical protein
MASSGIRSLPTSCEYTAAAAVVVVIIAVAVLVLLRLISFLLLSIIPMGANLFREGYIKKEEPWGEGAGN